MKYIISLIGNSNVGKSTLFNKLTLSNESLVSNIAGTTIDFKYKIGFKYKNFLFIDTIAYDIALEKKLNDYFLKILNISDIILFIVNNKLKITYLDIKLSRYLLSLDKIIYLVINKVDNYPYNLNLEYYNLGIKNIFPVSAYYNKGLKKLINNINKKYYSKSSFNDEYKKKIFKIIKFNNNYLYNFSLLKISIIGRQNVGKSTLLNTILKYNRVIINNIPGTTHDVISVPIKILNNNFIISDTPGIKSKKIKFIDKKCILKSINHIFKTNIIIFVIDIFKGITKEDYFILNFIKKSGKALIIVINKLDLLNNNNKKKIFINNILLKLNFLKNIDKVFISAKLKIGIKLILNKINKIYDFIKNPNINTNLLNKNLSKIINITKSNLINNRIKFKYVNIIKNNPLIIIIHGKNTFLLKKNDIKYIENCFYNFLKIKGIQIIIKIKN